MRHRVNDGHFVSDENNGDSEIAIDRCQQAQDRSGGSGSSAEAASSQWSTLGPIASVV